MSSGARTRLLWNPVSGRGRGARLIERIRAAFAAHGITDCRASQAPGDEARLVHEALADGVTTIVVAGGDGTWSKAAVALARAGSPARMAFVAAGTGNDFAKNLRAPARDPEAMARLVATGGVERRVDLGRVDDRWFTNVAGFGFDVAVLQASQRSRRLRGPAVYVAAALGELFGYAGFDARVAGHGGDQGWRRRLMLVFANGREFGGAFRIAPAARVDDGRIDAMIFSDGSRLSRIPLLVGALRGAHGAHRLVDARSGSEFTLECREPPAFELDGELHRADAATVTIRCVPGALRVLDAAVQTAG
jgi:diacylglycerol kinase (ATP)